MIYESKTGKTQVANDSIGISGNLNKYTAKTHKACRTISTFGPDTS